MFKYISEILGKFSMAQRITALLLLLLTITIITLTPKVIDATTQDCGELTEKVNRQQKEITSLNDDVDTLRFQLRKNSKECTDEIIKREKEIMEEIDRLKNSLRGMSSQNRIESRIYSEDTVVMSQPRIIEDPRPDMMMDGLNKIQRKLQKDIDTRGGK